MIDDNVVKVDWYICYGRSCSTKPEFQTDTFEAALWLVTALRGSSS